jgi:ABC-type branched-subunit amino acid transport system ATPase component
LAADKPLLEVRDIHAGYGKLDILHGISLDVSRGELVCIIGPNGSGKSTTLKTITGFLHPTSGHILLDGKEILGLTCDQILKLGLAYVPQGRIVFPQMTVRENLELGAYIEPSSTKVREALDRVWALLPILAERRDQKAGTMSGGEQQMLAIGRTLMTRPRMILLDEPSLGLSPKFVTLIYAKLHEMKQQGYTMLVVEQSAVKALSMADRGYVLELGRNRFTGAGQELLNDPEVKRLYLGG